MKAKVKSLGSVVDLSEYVYDEDGNEYTWDEVELIDDDKWQHYRIQASIAAMQAVLTNYEYYAEGIKTECENSNTTRPKVVAFMARELADALVAELKKGGKQ